MVKLNHKKKEQYTKRIVHALQDGNKELFLENFLKLHPSDQQDVFIHLSNPLRKKVYAFVSPKQFTEVFEGLSIEQQKLFFAEVKENYSSAMFNHLFTDDVVQFLVEIDAEKADHILDKMNEEKANKVRVLLSYQEETAGAIMTKEFISIASTDTAEKVIEYLRTVAPNAEIIYYNYVIDKDGVLVGVVSLRDLITARPDEMIENIMNSHAVSVDEDLDQEEVAKVIQKYDLLAVPVVSKDHRLLGIVTVDDIMDVMEDETTEDFGEISAAKGATDIGLSAFSAAKKRAPWIVLLMVLGLITGGVIQQFEDTLESVVLLAFFIPMIMDSGGNVGTQSLAISVRGLALGTIQKDGFLRLIRRELTTGALIGFACMLLISTIVFFIYGNGMLGIVVGVSILCTLSISAVIGALIPIIIDKLNIDPAVASGPFITTLNDIAGLMIYFTIATKLIEYI
ncbi:MAG TPA: magnesium transporter [Bacillota bacterium]|nr:magnesium transporter [Bacillota bacterium]